jgi:hypothetical protein
LFTAFPLRYQKIFSQSSVTQSQRVSIASIIRWSVVESSRDFTSRHVVAVVAEAINFRVDVVVAWIFKDCYLTARLEVAVWRSDGVTMAIDWITSNIDWISSNADWIASVELRQSVVVALLLIEI